MRTRLALLLLLAVFTSSDVWSAPRRPAKSRGDKAPTPTVPPAPAPVVTPMPAAPAPAAPAPGPDEDAREPSPARPPPPPAPTLAMRPRARAHGGFVDNMDCSACHTADGWSLSTSAGSSGFDHDRTGFALRGAHVQAECARCHSGKQPATNCDGCHRNPHRGRMDGTCAECHTATAWSDTRTLAQHRRTSMPLTGRHATVDCIECHKRQDPRQFSDLPTDCFSCHRTDYTQAIHPVHDGSDGNRPFGRDCARCHPTTRWEAAIGNPSNLARTIAQSGEHDAWFVLSTGNHRTAECSACHADSRRQTLVRCDGCHQDAELRARHGAPVSHAANACLRCHPRGAAR